MSKEKKKRPPSYLPTHSLCPGFIFAAETNSQTKGNRGSERLLSTELVCRELRTEQGKTRTMGFFSEAPKLLGVFQGPERFIPKVVFFPCSERFPVEPSLPCATFAGHAGSSKAERSGRGWRGEMHGRLKLTAANTRGD